VYPLFYLLGGQTGIGTGQLLPALSHESHGVKRLLHTTPVQRKAIERIVGYHLGNVNGRRMAGCMTALAIRRPDHPDVLRS